MTEEGIESGEWEFGRGAVLYEAWPDVPLERRLAHVVGRLVDEDTGDRYYLIDNGTHDGSHCYHAEDAVAEFDPAGWQCSVGQKPTYLLTRQHGVEDSSDLMTDGGQTADGSDRWKCPDCGRIVVDPGAPIGTCSCGSERIQLREWPSKGDWSPPEWPADSEYSPDPHEVETEIEYKPWKEPRGDGGKPGGDVEQPDVLTSSTEVKEKVEWLLYAAEEEYVGADDLFDGSYERDRAVGLLRDYAEHPNADGTVGNRAEQALEELGATAGTEVER